MCNISKNASLKTVAKTPQTCELCGCQQDVRQARHEDRGPVHVCESCIPTERFQILCDCPCCGRLMDAGENFVSDRCCTNCAAPALTVGEVLKAIATLDEMQASASSMRNRNKAAGLRQASNLLRAILDQK